MGNELENRVETAVQPVKKEPVVFGQLRSMEKEFAAAMPKGVEAQQLIRDAMTAIRKNDKLLRCKPDTLFGALMTAAQLGLRPNVLGQCYVIPYGPEAQFQIGYQGLIELAHRSGRVLSIVARTVYEADYFDLEYNVDKDVMVHKPTLDGNPGNPRFYYARATLTDGGYQMTNPITHEQMQAHRRKYSKAGSGSPWDTEFEAMAHKTVIKRLAKLLPKSTELAVALEADESVRLQVPGERVTPLPDVPGDVTYLDGEIAPTSAVPDGTRRRDANELRNRILAADSPGILAALFVKGEKEGLMDVVVENENGDEEELRLIAERKRQEMTS